MGAGTHQSKERLLFLMSKSMDRHNSNQSTRVLKHSCYCYQRFLLRVWYIYCLYVASDISHFIGQTK